MRPSERINKRFRALNLRNLLMQNFFRALLLVLFSSTLVQAQTPPGGAYPVTQSPTRADAAGFILSNTATNCTSVSQTAAQDTLTIPAPGGGLSIYISGFYYRVSQNATGVTNTGTIAASNITGNPVWDYNTALSTTGTSAFTVAETYPTGLKAAVPGTAVVFTPSGAQGANAYLCMRVAGWYGP